MTYVHVIVLSLPLSGDMAQEQQTTATALSEMYKSEEAELESKVGSLKQGVTWRT